MNEQQVRVWVGAFGKHPGWDDHLADQGLETQVLTEVRRLLYVEGIGGNLDSGSWDALDAGDRIDGFDHVFVWRWASGLVVGRMWSSSDGKGRKRYPMIVCAHCRGIASSWVVGPCLEALDRLARRCQECTDAAGVITAIDDARQELREASHSAPSASTGGGDDQAAIVEVSACLGKEGLERVAYQLEREFSSFLRTDEETGTRSRTVDVRPRSMRVPVCDSAAGVACDRWLRFMLERVDPHVPLLAIVRRGHDCCDLIAGEPTRTQLICLQASPGHLPLTTEIPYTIDEGFSARVQARIQAARDGTLRDLDPGSLCEAVTRTLRTPKTPDRSQLRLIGMIAGVVLALVIVIFAIIKLSASSGPTTTSEQPERIQPKAPTQERAQGPQPESTASHVETQQRRDAFLKWGKDYQRWFSALSRVRGSKRDLLEQDSYLAEGVFGVIERARRNGIDLNPLNVVSNPPTTVGELIANPPESIAHDRIWNDTQEANAVIDQVAQSLQTWPVRMRVRGIAQRLKNSGVTGLAEVLQQQVEAAGPGDGSQLVDAMVFLASLDSLDAVETAAAQIEQVQVSLEKMAATGDPVLVQESSALERALAAVRSAKSADELVERSETLAEYAQVAAMVGSFLDQGWQKVDREVFEDQGKAYATEDSGLERLRIWLAEARNPAMQKLDPALDPRVQMAAQSKLAELEGSFARIDESSRNAFPDLVDEIQERRASLERTIEELHGMPWNTQTRNLIHRQTQVVQQDLARLARSIHDLEGMVNVDLEKKLAEILARQVVSTSGLRSLDEIWQAGRDAIVERSRSRGDDTVVFRESNALLMALQKIEDAATAGGAIQEVPATWKTEAIDQQLTNDRNAIVQAAAESFRTGVVTDVQVEQVVATVRSKVREAEARMNQLLKTIITFDEHLHGFWGLSEQWADGQTLEQIANRFGTREQLARKIAPEVFKSWDALVQVSGEAQSREGLMSILDNPDTPSTGLVAAWFSLAHCKDGWPNGLQELERDSIYAGQVRTFLSGVSDESRRKVLEGRVAEAQRLGWANAMERCSDLSEFEQCLKRQRSFGGQIEDLDDSSRFNLAVVRIRNSVDPGSDDQANKESLERVLEGIGRAGLSPASLAWLARADEIASEDVSTVPPLDPSRVGPATAGWSVAESSDVNQLIYRAPWDSGTELVFNLVVLDDGRGTYLCQVELPVGLVSDLMENDAKFAEQIADTVGWSDPGRDVRRGMLTWEWAGTSDKPAMESAASWVSEWWVPLDEYFIETDEQPYPTARSPMQRISLSEALYISARLGCRLPTVEEWKAAYARIGGGNDESRWNLRDLHVAAQIAHVNAAGDGWREKMPPDLDAFEPLSGEPTGSFDDGFLWVRPAGDRGGELFQDIIGNVHEYVVFDALDQSEVLGERSVLPKDESADRWYPIARRIEAGVIGGSVFSRADAPVDRAIRVKDVPGGWSDVGLRLAFSSESGKVRRSVANRIESLVKSAPFPRDED